MWVAIGCGPDDVAMAVHDEVCGEPGPVRILELDDDRRLSYAVEVGDPSGRERRLFAVGYAPESDDESVVVEEFQLWSVGRCGEDPLLLSSEVAHVRSLDVWPDVELGCTSTGDWLTLDREGVRAPNVVFETAECWPYDETPWGLVAVEPHDEDFGAVVLHRYPEDPWAAASTRTVLLDPVRIRTTPQHVWPGQLAVLAPFEDDIFALTPADDLVHYSLLDGTSSVVASNVFEFEVSSDMRWIVWQDVVVTNGDAEWPGGAIWLLDRSTGSVRRLDDAALAVQGRGAFVVPGFVRLRLGDLYEAPERLYRLSDLASFDLPLELGLTTPIDDGRVLLGEHFGRGPLVLLDPATMSSRTLFDRAGNWRVVDDGVRLVEVPSCCSSDAYSEGKLWHVPFDGEPQLLARRSTAWDVDMPDDRVLINVDVDEDRLGNLVVVDPATLDELRVDTRVHNWSSDVDDDGELTYAVADEDRTGVWITKLAAAD